MKKVTLAKFNGTLLAKMLAALCVLNCVGAVTPPETHPSATPVKMEPAPGMNRGRGLATAPSPEGCAALTDKNFCRKKDQNRVDKACSGGKPKKCSNLCKTKRKASLSDSCAAA